MSRLKSPPPVWRALPVFATLAFAARATADTSAWVVRTVNERSPFEAAGVADLNGDGVADIFSGDSFYEGPSWKRHRVREVAFRKEGGYHEDSGDLPLDVNGDGHVDIVTCAYGTKRLGWIENPGVAGQPWIEHDIDYPGPSETCRLADINGDGRQDLLPNVPDRVVWYELAAQKPKVLWKRHDLGTQGSGHGTGMGDIDGDGRLDVVTSKGWYKQPGKDDDSEWTFHPDFDLGPASILIVGADFDRDGLTDLLWGNPHDYGLYWLRQQRGSAASPGEQATHGEGKNACTRRWVRSEIDRSFSQVHTTLYADLDGNGEHAVVTGKRIYAHNHDPGATEAPIVVAFRFDRKRALWTKQILHAGQPASAAPADPKDRRAAKDFPRGSVGTGVDLDAVDIDGDGDLDIICPGKTGLYILENPRVAPRK
jgi:hypothetical protein